MALFDAAPVSPAELEAHQAGPKPAPWWVPYVLLFAAGVTLGWCVGVPFGVWAVGQACPEIGPEMPVMFVRGLLP